MEALTFTGLLNTSLPPSRWGPYRGGNEKVRQLEEAALVTRAGQLPAALCCSSSSSPSPSCLRQSPSSRPPSQHSPFLGTSRDASMSSLGQVTAGPSSGRSSSHVVHVKPQIGGGGAALRRKKRYTGPDKSAEQE
eukprot:jgi/Mesen1/5258/ME000263S04366